MRMPSPGLGLGLGFSASACCCARACPAYPRGRELAAAIPAAVLRKSRREALREDGFMDRDFVLLDRELQLRVEGFSMRAQWVRHQWAPCTTDPHFCRT